MAANFPDELWMLVFRMGVDSGMEFRDVCAAALVCRRLRRLSGSDAIWEVLWNLDWKQDQKHEDAREMAAARVRPLLGGASEFLEVPGGPGNQTGKSQRDGWHQPVLQEEKALQQGSRGRPCWKSKYRDQFEKDKVKKMAFHRRRVLRARSQLAVTDRSIRSLQSAIHREWQALRGTGTQVMLLERSRSVATSVLRWQPMAVATRHQQLVEQLPADVESQLIMARQEAAVCREQIHRFTESLNKKKTLRSLQQAELASLMYSPAQELPLSLSSNSKPTPSPKPISVHSSSSSSTASSNSPPVSNLHLKAVTELSKHPM